VKCHEPARAQEYLRLGHWSTDTIDGLFRARVAAEPDREAITDPPNTPGLIGLAPQRLTWQELDARVDAVAALLLRAGVHAGDVVALQLPNCARLVQAFLAVVRIGAIVTPFPVSYREHEIAPMCARTGAVAAVTVTAHAGRALADELAAACPWLTVLAWGERPRAAAMSIVDDDLARADTTELNGYLRDIAAEPNDCVTVCWTSGTEAAPKAVPRCHGDWLVMGLGTQRAARLGPDDVLLSPFPMTSMAGISGMFLPWLMVGGRFVPHQPFDLAVFLGQIDAEHATYTVAPPALLTMLLHREDLLAGVDISSLRLIGSGSAPLSPATVRAWSEHHGVDVINFFGSNEGISLLSDPVDIPDADQRATFFPRYGVPGVRWSTPIAERVAVRLVDPENGREITESGVPGELRMAGPTIFCGYLGAGPAAPYDRSSFDADGFFRTGDVFEVAGERGEFLRYVDRLKDLIIRGGMNISPAELEGLLATHPRIADIAVIGVADPVLGERVCAVAVPGGELDLADVVAFLRARRIASFKLPERLELVDTLPRNALGKVLKRELRERFAGQAEMRAV
jgi:acyl-CoA synthetase (AMP-forming)/AMP-acid ligase II